MTQLSLFQRTWLDDAESVVLERLRQREFSSDDVHDVVPAPDVNNWMGVLFARLRCKGLVERVGSAKSRRDEANGRWVGTYRIKC
jgi:hypothetical protein